MSVTDYAMLDANGFTTVGEVVPDNLYDNFSVRRKVTVLSGSGVLKRGTAMGKITSGGKWQPSAADDGDDTDPTAITDGSQVVRGILLHDVDATSADVEAIVGRVGSCNGGAVILGSGHTLASIDDDCIDRGLILDTIIGA